MSLGPPWTHPQPTSSTKRLSRGGGGGGGPAALWGHGSQVEVHRTPQAPGSSAANRHLCQPTLSLLPSPPPQLASAPLKPPFPALCRSKTASAALSREAHGFSRLGGCVGPELGPVPSLGGWDFLLASPLSML